MTSVAAASANGCRGFNKVINVSFAGVSIPAYKNDFCFKITGKGRTIKGLSAHFVGMKKVCNYKYRLTSYDTEGKRLWRSSTKTVEKCHFDDFRYWGSGKVAPGKLCLALISNGDTKTSICHSITR